MLRKGFFSFAHFLNGIHCSLGRFTLGPCCGAAAVAAGATHDANELICDVHESGIGWYEAKVKMVFVKIGEMTGRSFHWFPFP
jgi:hypothetical protein